MSKKGGTLDDSSREIIQGGFKEKPELLFMEMVEQVVELTNRVYALEQWKDEHSRPSASEEAAL